jgi:DNA-binding Lrp family transcriptional regulator
MYSVAEFSSVVESDLSLINALQIAPRVPWAKIADVLGVSAATLARQWDRLSTSGEAWVSTSTVAPQSKGALLEVDCEASFTEEVALELCSDRRAVTIEMTSGGHHLLVSVSAPSVPELAAFIRDVRLVNGVHNVDTHVITSVVKDASRWRLGALSPSQIKAIQSLAPVRKTAEHELDQISQDIVDSLTFDGRMSFSEISHRCSVSVNTVRRRLSLLESSGWLRLRCDVSQRISGHEFTATIWISAPPSETQLIATSLAALPEVRAVTTVTGRANIVVVAWIRHASSLLELEMGLARQAPGAMIIDRVVSLRTFKRVGRLLGEDGRALPVAAEDPPKD